MTDITQTDPDLNSFLFTRSAWILSSTSASISTVCSILVIIFISRSKQLSSAYHKIMLFMSSWDVITSLAIALATLPMPADVHDIYPFIGMTFGNTTTCTFQGLSIFTGSMYTVLSNCTLNIYYVCAIRYGMSDEVINRRVLPIMLGISSLFICMMNTMGLSNEYFNPRPYEPFCLVGPYPHNCLEEDNDVECIRGGDISHPYFFGTTVLILGYVSFMIMVSSMLAVVVAVFKTELVWTMQYGQRGNDMMNPSRTSDFKNTRTALRQALMYIAASALTWVWAGIALLSPGKPWNDYLKMFFQPLQGFFNAAIFFASKVHILRKAKPALTPWQALVQVLTSPRMVPLMVVSQIEMLDDDDWSNLEEVDWTRNLKRTGIITTDMPPLSIVSSNDTPSLDLSRAMSSKDILVVKPKEKTPMSQDGLPQSPDQNQSQDQSDPHSNSEELSEHRPLRRTYYQWPPRTLKSSSSLSSRSKDSIWDFPFLGRRGSKSRCGADGISQDSRNQEEYDEERDLSGFTSVRCKDSIWDFPFLGRRGSKSRCGDDGISKDSSNQEEYDEEEAVEHEVTSERNLSGFTSIQTDAEMSSLHSQDQESSSVSQTGNCGSSYMGSSMNLSDIEDVSLDYSDSSEFNSSIIG